MSKRSSWLTILKKFFNSDTESRPEKGKRKRWIIGLFDSSTSSEANAASVPSTEPYNQHKEEIPELSAHNLHEYDWEIQIFATIRIQTAFRGYLAKKALRALKGIVSLQAIIRGQAVRRQAINTLKCLQSLVNIQSAVRAKGCNMAMKTLDFKQNQFQNPNEKDIKMDLNSQRRWDSSVLSKEDVNAMSLSRREASFKRDRIKDYWLSHRKSTEVEQSKVNPRRYWLEQWVDSQLAKREDLKTLDIFSTSARMREEFDQREHKLRNVQKHKQRESLVSPTRRSFHHHKRQHSSGYDSAFAASPTLPTYMAPTKSVEAKARSMSTPRIRPIHFDVYSEINSPWKYKLSPISSINSEATISIMAGGRSSFSQRSPRLKSPASSKQLSKGC